jgi:hypothetical protein
MLPLRSSTHGSSPSASQRSRSSEDTLLSEMHDAPARRSHDRARVSHRCAGRREAKLRPSPWCTPTWRGALDARRSASLIVFIGYSMPDSDGFMTTLLSGAMATRTGEKPPAVYIVDPCKQVHDRYHRLFPALNDIGYVGFVETVSSGVLIEMLRGHSEQPGQRTSWRLIRSPPRLHPPHSSHRRSYRAQQENDTLLQPLRLRGSRSCRRISASIDPDARTL